MDDFTVDFVYYTIVSGKLQVIFLQFFSSSCNLNKSCRAILYRLQKTKENPNFCESPYHLLDFFTGLYYNRNIFFSTNL